MNYKWQEKPNMANAHVFDLLPKHPPFTMIAAFCPINLKASSWKTIFCICSPTRITVGLNLKSQSPYKYKASVTFIPCTAQKFLDTLFCQPTFNCVSFTPQTTAQASGRQLLWQTMDFRTVCRQKKCPLVQKVLLYIYLFFLHLYIWKLQTVTCQIQTCRNHRNCKRFKMSFCQLQNIPCATKLPFFPYMKISSIAAESQSNHSGVLLLLLFAFWFL